jgi:hypothetical protein
VKFGEIELIPTLVVLVVVIIVPPTPTFNNAVVVIPVTFNVVALAIPRFDLSLTVISLAVNESKTISSLTYKSPPT